MIVAVIPAHNEQAGIAQTILSLQAQTVPPDSIVVAADNCTDDTGQIAMDTGAHVFFTSDNSHKKAGALNQAMDTILNGLSDDDFILAVDADSILCDDWIERAVTLVDDTTGAVSGAYVARKGKGIITLLQRAEYAQERRRISRRDGSVDVLSGTAVLFPVSVLWELKDTRGYIYDNQSLTEDFEVTLAIKALGYAPKCYKELGVITDVMETWTDLYRQRLRWQRGTIETLSDYGWNYLTKKLWFTNVLTYLSSLLIPLILVSWGTAIYFGLGLSVIWMLVLPVFMIEQVVSSRKAGLGPTVVAGLLIPMWFYDVFRTSVYWIALVKSIRSADASWH